jgi:hypothetical protein
MTKVTMDAQLSGSLHYGNIRYVIHKNYMQDLNNVKYESFSIVRRKLLLPCERDEAIPNEGTNLQCVAKLQGAVKRQYSFYAYSCLVKIHMIL